MNLPLKTATTGMNGKTNDPCKHAQTIAYSIIGLQSVIDAPQEAHRSPRDDEDG